MGMELVTYGGMAAAPSIAKVSPSWCRFLWVTFGALRCTQKIARLLGDEKRIPELQDDVLAQKTMKKNSEWKRVNMPNGRSWHKNWVDSDRV